MDDLAVVERQLGRAPRAFRRVAVRCPFGKPAVAEQAPFDRDGTPFPTQFWVTCRHLVAQIARVEAAGGVERWSRAAADRPRAAGQPRARRRPSSVRCGRSCRVGIGGLERGGSLKCLHAHAAFALARPGYELGELILAEVEPLWPEDGCCSAL